MHSLYEQCHVKTVETEKTKTKGQPVSEIDHEFEKFSAELRRQNWYMALTIFLICLLMFGVIA